MLVLGKHDDNTIEQMRQVAQHAKYTALMSDGHYGYIMPVGGVAAYENKVSISGVGLRVSPYRLKTGKPVFSSVELVIFS